MNIHASIIAGGVHTHFSEADFPLSYLATMESRSFSLSIPILETARIRTKIDIGDFSRLNMVSIFSLNVSPEV